MNFYILYLPIKSVNISFFSIECIASTNLIVPVLALITTELVVILLFPRLTIPFSKSPSVIPVAAKNNSSPLAKSSKDKTLSMS